MLDVICFSCSHKNTILSSTVGRRDECMRCKSDLHVCKNCEHYDCKSYNECRETSADVVKEKERSNFCDYFKPGKGLSGVDQAAKLKSAAEALFKK